MELMLGIRLNEDLLGKGARKFLSHAAAAWKELPLYKPTTLPAPVVYYSTLFDKKWGVTGTKPKVRRTPPL